MFGYVIPDKPNMYIKDYNLYRAYYCGLCKSIGKACGQLMRFSTTYDMTFLALFVHGIKGDEGVITAQTCVLNPLKKKAIACPDGIFKQIAHVNSLLAHYKVADDVRDENSAAKKIANAVAVGRAYKKARLAFPELDAYMRMQFNALDELESSNCKSADIAADPSAKVLKEIARTLIGGNYTDEIGELFYNIGKWVYIADAVDDIEKDADKGCYNPFLTEVFTTREHFLATRRDELEILLYSCYNAIIKNYDSIKPKVNEGAITNILWYGILSQTQAVLRRTCKCRRTRI